jgi:uncharacterized protein
VKIQKICIVIILSLAICTPTLSIASEESHRAAIDEMLRLSNVDKMIEPMFDQFKGLLKNQFAQMGVSEEQMPILEKYNDKLFNVMKEEMAWSKMRNDYIDIYAKVYTEEEILDINKFYRSPAGKKMIEKMPQLLQETMTITQKNMQTLIPKIQQISAEMAQEIQNSK